MVLSYMKYQFMQKILSTLEILIHPLKVFQIGMFLCCCGSFRKITILEEEGENPPQKKRDIIFLNTYQNSQIMASYPLKMVRHVLSANN